MSANVGNAVAMLCGVFILTGTALGLGFRPWLPTDNRVWTCGWGCGTQQISCSSNQAACCCYDSSTGTYSCSCMSADCNGLTNCQVGF
jgi:hypothetical protein